MQLAGELWAVSAYQVVPMVKNLPAKQEAWVQSLGQEDPLEKGTATHSSIPAWRIPRTEKPGRLQSIGSQRVGHDWSGLARMNTWAEKVMSRWQRCGHFWAEWGIKSGNPGSRMLRGDDRVSKERNPGFRWHYIKESCCEVSWDKHRTFWMQKTSFSVLVPLRLQRLCKCVVVTIT